MEEKLVTIIVPVYNVELYVRECLDSIISQTHKNLEILIVNDGSTDSSLTILQEFEKKDHRIKVFTKENGGLSSARNYAIDHAKGEYLTFIDSDDYVEKNYVEVLLKCLVNCKADISIINSFHVENEKKIKIIKSDSAISEYSTKEILSKMYSKENNFIGLLQSAQGKLYKKELFEKIRYPLGRKYEDAFTTYKLYLESKKIVYINIDLYAYRIREGSILRSGYSLSNLDAIDMFEERIETLKDRGYSVSVDRYYYCVKLLKESAAMGIYFPSAPQKKEIKDKYLKEKKSIWKALHINQKLKLLFFQITFSLAPKIIVKRLVS